MTIQAHNVPSEKDIAADLEARLSGLTEAGRCTWRKEVRMLCWTHSARSAAQMLRIDFIAELDGLLIGVEAKAPPEKPADLGRYLFQCAQYASGVIGANTQIPEEWTGKPLWGVFLCSDSSHCSENVRQHGARAKRLFGPANVGFVHRDCRHENCFELSMCAERAWSKEHGWHRGMVAKASRAGNGSARFVDTSDVSFPDERTFA